MAKLTLYIEGEKHELRAEDNETILDAALRNGIDAPYSCMSGTCNACQAHLSEGKVQMDECDALTEDEIAEGEVLTCQAKAKSESVTIRWPE